MTEEFTIQCPGCGTHYNDLQDVCPYCGQPQPEPNPEPLVVLEEPPIVPAFEEPPSAYEPEVPFLDTGLDAHTAEDELLADDYPLEEDPFADDDIFAVAEEPQAFVDTPLEYSDEYEDDYEPYETPPVEQYDDDQPDTVEAEPRRFGYFTLRRLFSGCLLLLLCLGLFYGALGILAVREGLEERSVIAKSESQQHFERGQAHLADNAFELAIAEFERAVALNPNFTEARQALRETQQIAQSQPTPTSETRSAAAADLFGKAGSQLENQNWDEAVQTLLQVRDLDPDYQSRQVSELLYTAYMQMGLQKTSPGQLAEALNLFEYALVERPNDAQAAKEKNKALLYLEGDSAADNDPSQAVEAFSQLYQEQNNYLDVKQRLQQAYEALGDEFLNDRDWCQAAAQYQEAIALQTSTTLQAKFDNSNNRCQGSETTSVTPQATRAANNPTIAVETNVPAQPATSITPTVATAPASPGGGSIVYSAFNFNENRWEIVAIPPQGGTPTVLVTEATMPAVSPNGQLLLYHAELVDSEGLHILNLSTGEDTRATRVRGHILPRWGGDNNQFLFVAQEGSTGRWLAHLGFADAKSDPLILRDGRTPDWSPDGKFIAFQGSDPDGNNPGIYTAPFDGGEPVRLTNHESDRSPDFSPNGSQIAYMSTRSGNWDIYVVSAAGSAPHQITTSPGNDGLPVWSPDGRQLAYVSDADGSWAIYVINLAGGNPAKVTEWDGAKHDDWLMTQIWWAR